MVTPLDVEAGVKGQIATLVKDSQEMTFYRLFSYFKFLGTLITSNKGDTIDLFNSEHSK